MIEKQGLNGQEILLAMDMIETIFRHANPIQKLKLQEHMDNHCDIGRVRA